MVQRQSDKLEYGEGWFGLWIDPFGSTKWIWHSLAETLIKHGFKQWTFITYTDIYRIDYARYGPDIGQFCRWSGGERVWFELDTKTIVQ